MSQEVNSIEELIAAGTSELQMLADAGNTVAQRWLWAIRNQPITPMKLKAFGEMRVALMGDESAEARQVYEALWPKEESEQ